MGGFLVFENISKSFGNFKVLNNVSLEINAGEIFSLLGPSGCGKTTLLRIVAGFESPDSGRILLDGKDITDLPPNQRKVNTVFQNYALFPNMSVWDNIAFGLRMAKKDKSFIKSEVERMLDMVQLTDQSHKKPDKLSGGQKQRVAIARALINKPEILLLDEPLAALDLKLRQRMLVELDWIHDEIGITFMYVTHDQGEAMSLSDRVAVMNKGEIEQIGNPPDVYEAPKSSFVAAFIGDTNFFSGDVISVTGNYSKLKIDGFPDMLVYNDKPTKLGDKINLSIRPEKFMVSKISERPTVSDKHNMVEGIIEEVVYMGSHTKYWIRVDDYLISSSRFHDQFMENDDILDKNVRAWLIWHADNCYMLEHYSIEHEALLTLPDDEVIAEIESAEVDDSE